LRCPRVPPSEGPQVRLEVAHLAGAGRGPSAAIHPSPGGGGNRPAYLASGEVL